MRRTRANTSEAPPQRRPSEGMAKLPPMPTAHLGASRRAFLRSISVIARRGGPPPSEQAGSAPRSTAVLVSYLRSLDAGSASDGPVLKRHLATTLRRAPDLAAPLLCDRLPNGSWLLPPAAARRLLAEAAPAAAVPALEAMLAMAQPNERPACVAALIEALTQDVKAAVDGAADPGASPATSGAPAVASSSHESFAAQRLLGLLHDTLGTDAFDAAAALMSIEASSSADAPPLARHRLLILGSAGRHAEAIEVLTTVLVNDLNIANEYCVAHSGRAPSAFAAAPLPNPPSLALQLLDRYVHPLSDGSPMLQAVNALLANWPDAVGATDALRRLPPATPIRRVESGLSALLTNALERQRHVQKRAALLRAVSGQARAELQLRRGTRVLPPVN